MQTRNWVWAAMAAALLTSANSANAQFVTRSIDAVRGLSVVATAYQGIVDPSKTTVEKWESDGGKRVVETKTEYDKDGKKVKKTTTTTDYTGRESDKDRTVKKKETREERYGPKGKDGETTTTEVPNGTGTKTTVVDDPAGSAPKRTISEEEKDAEGNTTKKKTYHRATGNKQASETDYKDGKPVKETRWDKDGNKESETEFDKDGKPVKETRWDKDGNKTEFEDFDKDGKPRKVTTYHKNGQKKSEGKVDDKGNVTEKKEFDERGREVKKTDAEGNVEETEYEGTTNKVRKKTVTHPDGSKDVTNYKDGQPEETRKYNPRGQQISSLSHALPTDSIILAPSVLTSGESFQLTIATLSGEVVANQPVTLDGGTMGKIETTTDLNGVVTAKAPEGWRTIRIVAGALSAGMIIEKLSSGTDRRKSAQPPAFVQPGNTVSIPCEGMAGTLDGQTLTIGGKNAKIVAASPTEIKAIVPSTLATGSQSLILSQAGQTIAEHEVECVQIQWDALSNALSVGQSAQRTLRVIGTTKSVPILVQDRNGDAVEVRSTGRLRSSGGTNNVLVVGFVATKPGSFAIRAEVAQGGTEYEKDLENAERARKESAGWADSAKTQSSDDLKEAFNRAAKNLLEAARDWDQAADARMKGDDAKAAELEQAAAEHEAAAKAFTEKDWSKGKAAEAAAAMHERNAAGK